MSIANSTLHFHFPLVVGTDRPLFEDYNQTMETLDEKLYESISTLETIPQEITDLQTAVNGMATQISALETFETEQTGTNQLVNNAILALQQATAVIPTKFDSAGIADPYDAEHGTYVVGDVVTYNGQRYECSQAVTAAEPFDADKWNAVDIQTVLTAIKNTLTGLTPVTLASVTASGSNSYSNLLNSLFSDLDITFSDFRKLTLSISTGGVMMVFNPSDYNGSRLRFTRAITNASACEIATCELQTTASHFYAYNTGTSTVTDLTSDMPTAGSILSIVKIP